MSEKVVALLGLFVANTVVQAVGSLAVAGSQMTTEAWLLSAALPTVLLLAYWFWIEPRNRADRTEGRRLRRALDYHADHEYRMGAGKGVSKPGQRVEDAPDSHRRGLYERLGVKDLFEPSLSQGAVALTAKASEGTWHSEDDDAYIAWLGQAVHDISQYLDGDRQWWQRFPKSHAQQFLRARPKDRISLLYRWAALLEKREVERRNREASY